jgi:thiol-disulfide isomerase/thioredoxin/outer membrane lipoprotein-sorting protein
MKPCVLLLVLLLAPTLHSQTPPASIAPGLPGSDALPFLTDLFSRYAHATIYHLEYTDEAELKGEYMRNWHKSTVVAVVGPRNQYRFQYRGESGEALQLSDGTTEWIYTPGLNQYTQQPTPSDGPSKIRTSASMALQRLSESRSTVHSIARRGEMIQRATFAPDQDVQIGDKTVPCVVVTTEGMLPGWGGKITTASTFWVEKQSGLIRKSVSRTEGELLGSSPGARYVSEDQRIYSVATLNPSFFADDTFAFTRPASAVLVKQFTDKEGQELAKLVGKPLPAITLKDSAGREVSLQSFQGKHLLLDFWATWCAPCRESLPGLEKLYTEYKDKGLVLLSLDEDQEPQKAADFWSKSKVPWPNYHLDKLAAEKFPPHGIPYFVLIDPSGKIIFSQAGSEDEELRAAVASMDPSAKTAPPTTH